MNKEKVKKTLVRNPERPKTSTVSAPQLTNLANGEVVEPETVSTKTEPDPNPRFDAPEMHSTLKLSKKIDEIVKPSIRQTKSLTDMDKMKLAGSDRIARQVNFRHDQTVFKDLIPLGDKNEFETELITDTIDEDSEEEELDPEPNFADFAVRDEKVNEKIYLCMPEATVSGWEQNYEDCNPIDGLRLYKIMQGWYRASLDPNSNYRSGLVKKKLNITQ
ncbi:unnamed protein product [Ceutorhynchus assimilis]|uniref:Protein phosphatase 1 regulatory subunit 35 C-terminal domain-containing protein n=1 Tax=Ceutorhynchus assimilis TaxID=467358 RepID=A0A9N9QSH0_9CUCU|nr:unnamed protein product [Ceutorhynchus assimilis]